MENKMKTIHTLKKKFDNPGGLKCIRATIWRRFCFLFLEQGGNVFIGILSSAPQYRRHLTTTTFHPFSLQTYGGGGGRGEVWGVDGAVVAVNAINSSAHCRCHAQERNK